MLRYNKTRADAVLSFILFIMVNLLLNTRVDCAQNHTRVRINNVHANRNIPEVDLIGIKQFRSSINLTLDVVFRYVHIHMKDMKRGRCWVELNNLTLWD